MIAIAKRNYPEIDFSIADMREFKPKVNADAVWAGYSLFHFEQTDLEKTIKQVKTCLQPTGVIELVMREGMGECEMDKPFLPGEKIYAHLYSEKQLRFVVAKLGFTVIDHKRKTPMHP